MRVTDIFVPLPVLGKICPGINLFAVENAKSGSDGLNFQIV
jgi:hypothetical protein